MKARQFIVRPFEARTLSWWRTRRDRIDMNPLYQRRGRLWSETDKAYLVDSILNGFDIPKLYVADFTFSDSVLNERKLPYAIIDGKQRFEAIFDFFDGTVVLNESFVLHERPDLALGGLGYRDLQNRHSELAEVFDNFNLSVMSVITDSEELINELFVRLNRSKPLTGAEIRNAMRGPVPALIRELGNLDFFRSCVAFPTKRGQDLNAAAKILLFEFAGEPQETKKKQLDRFVVEAADSREKLELAWRRAHDTITDLSTVFLPRDKLLSAAGIIPSYYWFFRKLDEFQASSVREFLLWFNEARRSNRERASEIGKYRVDADFSKFDRFNRSTNDLLSQQKRVEILLRKYKAWVAESRSPQGRH